MGKVVFITGATSGIGKMIAQLCIERGYSVYATGQNESSLKELSSIGAHVLSANLSKTIEIDELLNKLPSVDVAIINAGVGTFKNANDLVDEEIDMMIDVNIKAPIYLVNRLAKQMIERKSGHFIMIGSQAGKVATKKASVYAATKHAMTGFTNGLRMELSPYNIDVTGIYPGPIDTPFIVKADSTNSYRDSMEKYLLNPEKVAKAVVQTIEKPVREMNLPRMMSLTSKLYAVAPGFIERVGRRFFNKK